MLIPASVRGYLHDRGLGRAVGELLAISDRGVLEGMTWSDVPRFYRAQLAARQLESEWAIFAVDAWEAIWGGLLDHWTALTPDEQMASDADVGIDLASLSDTGDASLWFGRLFVARSFTFYASISATPSSGLRLKVSCDRAGRSIDFGAIAAEIDEYDNWTCGPALSLDRDEFDCAPLRSIAAEAVRMADAAITPRRCART